MKPHAPLATMASSIWLRALLLGVTLLATVATAQAATVIDLDWRDAARERTLPLKLRLPDGDARVPVVLFSHGLGGSREGGAAWGEYWADHGYLVIHVQHPGSDEALWKDVAPAARRASVVRGATAEQLLGRVDDIRFVLDELARRQRATDAPAWLRRADLTRIAMTGHSFGAQTTMALAGQHHRGPIRDLGDARLRAFIAFSPLAQGLKASWPERYGAMTRPFLSVTGTLDGDVLGNGASAARRAAVFDAQPAGDKYRVVFEGANHFVFAGGDPASARRLSLASGRPRTATPDALAAAIAERTQVLTLKFLDAYLKSDAPALRWLHDEAGAFIGDLGAWSAK